MDLQLLERIEQSVGFAYHMAVTVFKGLIIGWSSRKSPSFEVSLIWGGLWDVS